MNGRVLVLDLETTGLPPHRGIGWWAAERWPHIVELAWAVFDGEGVELAARSALVRPDGYRIPREATKIHGITQVQALAGGRPLEDVVGGLVEALADPDLTVVAHNLGFDRPVLAAAMVRTGKHRDQVEALLFGRPCVCTMELGTDYCRIPGRRGRYKWPTLDELHRKLFGAGVAGGHRALVDVRATARCFFRLRELGVVR